MAIREASKEAPVFESVDDFLSAPETPSGLFVIMIGGHPADFRYDDRGHETTVVLLHPAINSRVKRLPVFIGSGVTESLHVNRLLVSDSSLSLHEGIQAGWFAGNSKQPELQAALAMIFEKVTAGKRTIYFGLSAGGFASLVFSSVHPGSIAVPVNPQTHLANHPSPRVRKWTIHAWGLNSPSDERAKEMPPVLTDVCDLYSQPLENRVAYIQNTGDEEHMRIHWKRFKDEVHPQNLAGSALVYAADGHIAPSVAYMTAVLDVVVNAQSWDQVDFSAISVSPVR
ncbi:hypothetical protein [Paeniglutamicibacter psychrophenolicus]|uniref:hypothetical protein n=1 Tax=Paeniglutamicibacter psychrophenolicus TaxID=257454 RepID=UPI00277EA029|nr:hypothetical protein [Paeniglutamicibacter psychrophenolicus]MDQ0095964.1 hypothetical protein [Paeniglutamicibacter psychrophenolicus]